MNKNIITGIPIIVTAIVAYSFFEAIAPKNISESELQALEKVTTVNEPSLISNLHWSFKLDCSYKNPPKKFTIILNDLNCEKATHNINILKSYDLYFRPQNHGSDIPPYCLFREPASSLSIKVETKRQEKYCK